MAELKPTRIIEINTLERIFCDFHPYGRGHGIPKTIGNATRLWETITNNAIEPNTRALDERVKELRERLVKKREAILDRLTDTRPDDSIGDVAAISGRKRGHQDAIDIVDALFPAELKEKLKESEDG